MNSKTTNEYILTKPISKLIITKKTGEIKEVLFDNKNYEKIKQYTWTIDREGTVKTYISLSTLLFPGKQKTKEQVTEKTYSFLEGNIKEIKGSKYIYKKTCNLCGKEYMAKRKESKYCSNECKNNAHKVKRLTIKCEQCGKEIDVREKEKRKYCSMNCAGKAANLKNKKGIDGKWC